MGLHLISREPNKLLVVFPDNPTLLELRRRVHEYSTHDKAHYANIGAIDDIVSLEPEDKVGHGFESGRCRWRAGPPGCRPLALWKSRRVQSLD